LARLRVVRPVSELRGARQDVSRTGRCILEGPAGWCPRMITRFARADTSVAGRWWWTIDCWSLAALGGLIAIGLVLAMAATPPVAERIGLDAFSFVRRQFVLLPVAIAVLLGITLMEPRQIRRLALLGFLISVALLALTFVIGAEIKGARRWINLGGF